MNPEQDLEKLIDHELRSLPAPSAPETLAPRVMAAIAAQAALPWHRQTWFEWPRGWQIASGVLTVAFLATLMTLAPWRALPDAEPVTRLVGQVRFFVDGVGETGGRVLRIAVPLWGALAQQYLIYALVGVGALTAAVVALGSAARQLVLKEIRS